MVEPVVQESSLAEVLATLEPIEEGFPTIDDPPVRPEETLTSPICPAVSTRREEYGRRRAARLRRPRSVLG